MELSTEQLVQRITATIERWDGDDIARLASEVLAAPIAYKGDEQFAFAGGMYLIVSDSEKSYWSNSFGWTYEITEAEIFATTELSLPNCGTPDARYVKADEAPEYTED